MPRRPRAQGCRDQVEQVQRWHVCVDKNEMEAHAAQLFLEVANASIKRRGRFAAVMPGGRTPIGVFRLLRKAPLEWSACEFFLSDERCLPAGHHERNSVLLQKEFASALRKGLRFHPIPVEEGPSAAAERYSEVLRPVGRFDLVFLGVGEDGHTASLFAGADWSEAEDTPSVVVVRGAPKWPAERISLSVARLNHSERAMFVAAGASKRNVVAAWAGGKKLPVASVKPADGVDIFLDVACAAGSGLKRNPDSHK
jgi:6-phosphogluconolactonase